MAVRKINESTLTAIGDAIRSKTGGSALINPEDMADEIDSIQTGGGTKVLTKLAEYTISEPVYPIDINETEQMQGCEVLYIIAKNVVLSSADWIYPIINDLSTVNGGMGYTDKVSTWNAKIVLCQSLVSEDFTNRNCMFNLSTLRLRTVPSVQKIGFRLYTSGVTFNSGTIEIWGYV